MATSKRHISRRSKVKKTVVQIVYSEPHKEFIEDYLTPKGKRLLLEGKITDKEAWKKYGKKRYRINPDAKPIRTITHHV